MASLPLKMQASQRFMQQLPKEAFLKLQLHNAVTVNRLKRELGSTILPTGA